MVTTRSQLKNKAAASPDLSPAKPANKQPRKKKAAAEGQQQEQPAQQQQRQPTAGLPPLAIKNQGDMGARASKQAAKQAPDSHHLASLPASPVRAPAASEFTIPAHQAAQQAEQQQQAVAAAAAPPTSPAPAAEEADTVSVQPLAAAAAAAQALTVGGGEQAEVASAAPPPPPPPQQQQQAQQQAPAAAAVAPPPKPLSRDDKPLKPLPDQPVACDKLPDGPEPVVVEVEYIAREDLQPLVDPAAVLDSTLAGLESSDWVEATRALNVLRQLTVHHAVVVQPHLERAFPAVLKAVKSLRSSLCKTAIMAVADLYETYGDALLPQTDVGGQAKPATSLLAQLLLKAASNDKRFVVEEAQRALQTLAQSLSADKALPLLLPYAEHKNPKVRGKAAGAVQDTLARMQPAEVAAFGLPALLKSTARLLTDNTPEAREAAKQLVAVLRAAFEDAGVQERLNLQVPEPEPAPEGEDAPAPLSKWEHYCQQTLGGSAALAVRKASTTEA